MSRFFNRLPSCWKRLAICIKSRSHRASKRNCPQFPTTTMHEKRPAGDFIRCVHQQKITFRQQHAKFYETPMPELNFLCLSFKPSTFLLKVLKVSARKKAEEMALKAFVFSYCSCRPKRNTLVFLWPPLGNTSSEWPDNQSYSSTCIRNTRVNNTGKKGFLQCRLPKITEASTQLDTSQNSCVALIQRSLAVVLSTCR